MHVRRIELLFENDSEHTGMAHVIIRDTKTGTIYKRSTVSYGVYACEKSPSDETTDLFLSRCEKEPLQAGIERSLTGKIGW